MRTILNINQASDGLATDIELLSALNSHVADVDAHPTYCKLDNAVNSVNGRKGIITLTKTDVGLGLVDNIADYDKPLSASTVNALASKVNVGLLGTAGGVATLDSTGKVPASQLPSFVDDVLEAANLTSLPTTGEAGKIYVTLDTNKTYRWSGSAYVYITSGAVDSVAGKTGVVTLAKADVGLDAVDNTADLSKPVSVAQNNAINSAQTNAIAASAPISHVGSSGASHSVVTGSVNGFMIAADKVKLDAVSGSNTGDETLATIKAKLGIVTLSGSNTGDQTNISGNADTATTLQTTRTINGVSFNGSGNITINAVDSTARVDSALLGIAGGVATLDSGGKVPASQLPSYVDDVLEFNNLASFPVTGTTGLLYVALDTNRLYRWSGSVYTFITSGAVDSVAGKTGIVTLVKGDVGLNNADNTSDINKPVSTLQQVYTDTAQSNAIATSASDATSKANAAQANAIAASAPVAHVGSMGVAHGAVTTTVNGFMIAADKVKLNAVSGTNTGDETLTSIKSKLGITTLSGSNTGDQTTITGNAGTATTLQTACTINGVSFNGSANITVNAVDSTARVASSLLGAANGVATLDASGTVPANQLPSYVDDVLEFANLASMPAIGETGKIYVALDTNKTYRWSGSIYVYITSGAVDSVNGKTGVVSLVKADIGLANVDNTSDVNKPISTATQTALDAKVSNSLLGVPNGVAILNSTGKLTYSQTPAKIVYVNMSAMSGTAIIAMNGNTPLVTDGASLANIALSPDGVNTKLAISGTITIDCSNSSKNIVLACFRGNTCIGALATNFVTAGRPLLFSFDFFDPDFAVNGTSTYSLRFGSSTSTTWYVNRMATLTLNGMTALNRVIKFEEII